MTDYHQMHRNWRAHLVEASSCPIKTKLYGGLPGGGGYGSGTEYEVGAQQMAEAVHCILGSIGKAEGGNDYRIERGHIEEELGIVMHVLNEYSKDLYTDRIWTSEEQLRAAKYKEEWIDRLLGYAQKSVNSIRANSPVLERTARAMKSAVSKDYDPVVQQLIEDCYDVVIVLAQEMGKSVSGWPDRPVDNAFKKSTLRRAVANLQRSVKELYR